MISLGSAIEEFFFSGQTVLLWVSRHDQESHLKSDWVIEMRLGASFQDICRHFSLIHNTNCQTTCHHFSLLFIIHGGLPWWAAITLPNGHFPCGILSLAIKTKSPGMKKRHGFTQFSLFCSFVVLFYPALSKYKHHALHLLPTAPAVNVFFEEESSLGKFGSAIKNSQLIANDLYQWV